jgi:hypothetical protein
MGHLCDITSKYGAHSIADFVCPTPECREAFGADFLIWVDRIKEGRFEDTNKLFVPPVTWDYRVTPKWEMAQYEAELIRKIIQSKKDMNKIKLSVGLVSTIDRETSTAIIG